MLCDVRVGEELTRPYGVSAWIMMTPSRLSDPHYCEWDRKVFSKLLSESTPKQKHETHMIMCEHVMFSKSEY